MKKDIDTEITAPQDLMEMPPDENAAIEYTADKEEIQTTGKSKRKKKPAVITAVIVIAVLYFVFFNLRPMQNTVTMINAIGDVSLDSKQNIEDARKAYDSLPVYLQKYVSDYSVLTEAEEKYKKLYCLSLLPKLSLDSIGMEVSASFNNNTLTIVENSTTVNYTDVMILGASVVSPMITSTSQEFKSKVDAAGYKDVDVIVESRVSNIPIATAKNGTISS